MTRRRRLPRHLLAPDGGGRQSQAPRRGAVTGPVAQAWLAAVESALPPATRTIARRRLSTAHTRRVTFVPGSVRVEVRQASYRNQLVAIRVPEADEDDWKRLLAVASAHGRWLAALAAGELPDDLATALVQAQVVPPGETLRGECTCRTDSGLCVHAAIAGHVAATALSADPAGMLLLRGMGPERLRERIIRELPGNPASGPARDPAGMDWNALVLGDGGPLPEPPRPPDRPGLPPQLPDPPAASDLRAVDLEDLAADAAVRALQLLAGEGDGGLELDADADLARRVASMARERLTAVAGRTEATEEELAALASAWRIGGAGAVAALRHPWRVAPRTLEPGILALEQTTGGDVSWRMNRVLSANGCEELALGRDGLWYLVRRSRRTAPAVLAGPGAEDPRTLFDTGPEPQAVEEAESPDPTVEQLRLLLGGDG